MDLQSIFTDSLKEELLKKVSEKIGSDKEKTSSALSMALPKILGQLGKNASSEDGVKDLDKALDKGHNTPDINLDLEDGAKILSHIMGNKTGNLEKSISQKTNLGSSQASDMLKLVSSFVMENLGKAKNEGKINNSNLSGIMGMAKKFLDKDGDGDIKDDLFSMGMDMFFGKKK